MTGPAPVVATLGSHSALQVLRGARDEGLANLVVAAADRAGLYRRYDFIDDVLTIPGYDAFGDVDGELARRGAVLVPHGSFVAYLGADSHAALQTPYFGNKRVLRWEGERQGQETWLRQAGLVVPQAYSAPDEIDAWPVLAKRHGAPGGRGCFLAASPEALARGLAGGDPADFVFQRYVVGVTLYLHYFQSVVDHRLEILSMDRRYESNVDGLGRLPAALQADLSPDPSYVVVGNSPLVLRESMLDEAYRMGEAVVAASRELVGPRGLWGPFCLETVITPDLTFHVIEISCRIVAGTNLFVNGSPYAALFFDEPMSTGRRIARELRRAWEQGRLAEVVDGASAPGRSD